MQSLGRRPFQQVIDRRIDHHLHVGDQLVYLRSDWCKIMHEAVYVYDLLGIDPDTQE